MVLLGKFYEVKEALFLYRDHPLTSVNAHRKTNIQIAATWFAPENKYKLQVPSLRWVQDFLHIIFSMRMSAWNKALSVLSLSVWAASNWREHLRDVLWALQWPIRRKAFLPTIALGYWLFWGQSAGS
jgi:hypothetical protein